MICHSREKVQNLFAPSLVSPLSSDNTWIALNFGGEVHASCKAANILDSITFIL